MAKATLEFNGKELEIDTDKISVRDGIKAEGIFDGTWDEIARGLATGNLKAAAAIITVLAQKSDDSIRYDDVLDLNIFDLYRTIKSKVEKETSKVNNVHPTEKASNQQLKK